MFCFTIFKKWILAALTMFASLFLSSCASVTYDQAQQRHKFVKFHGLYERFGVHRWTLQLCHWSPCGCGRPGCVWSPKLGRAQNSCQNQLCKTGPVGFAEKAQHTFYRLLYKIGTIQRRILTHKVFQQYQLPQSRLCIPWSPLYLELLFYFRISASIVFLAATKGFHEPKGQKDNLKLEKPGIFLAITRRHTWLPNANVSQTLL